MNQERLDRVEYAGYRDRMYDLQSDLLERMSPDAVVRFDWWLGKQTRKMMEKI